MGNIALTQVWGTYLPSRATYFVAYGLRAAKNFIVIFLRKIREKT